MSKQTCVHVNEEMLDVWCAEKTSFPRKQLVAMIKQSGHSWGIGDTHTHTHRGVDPVIVVPIGPRTAVVGVYVVLVPRPTDLYLIYLILCFSVSLDERVTSRLYCMAVLYFGLM